MREEVLESILIDLNGASADIEASAVISTDGLMIACVMPAGLDEDRVGAMTAAMLSLGDRTSAELVRGDLEQVMVKGSRGYVLIIFNESADQSGGELSQTSDAEPLVRQLEDELQRTKDQLRTMIEQYETTNEEYKAANEELQAINEELTTVNQEMKFKVEELSQANSDLQNLLASTQIATIFIDRELRIRRYTASAQAIFNLIASDVGRPLAHITHKLDYDRLTADATQVLDTLAKVEREVQSQDGQTYLMRMVPYRTLDDKIDGVTLIFVGISDRR